MRPFDAVRAIRRVFADPDATEQVFEVIDALQGPNLKWMRARLQRSATGRRLLETTPSLLPLLSDRAALRALPEGSLGRAYLAFVESGVLRVVGTTDGPSRIDAGSINVVADGRLLLDSDLTIRKKIFGPISKLDLNALVRSIGEEG